MKERLLSTLILLLLLCCSQRIEAQSNIVCQYWLDNDVSNAALVSTDSEDLSLAIDASNLSTGVHFMNVRAQKTAGVWGPIYRQMFYVTNPHQQVSKLITGYRYSFNEITKEVALTGPVAEYELNETFQLPYDNPSFLINDSCHFIFTETNTVMTRNEPMTFALSFKDETGEWGVPQVESFTIADTVTIQNVSLSIPGSAILSTPVYGGYNAVKMDIDNLSTITLKASSPCLARLYSQSGTLLASCDSTTIGKDGLTREYEAGTYYAIVYGNQNEITLTASNNSGVGTPEPYAVLSDNDTVLTFYFDEQKTARNGMSVGPFSNTDYQAWYAQRESITTAIFDSSFANCTSITSTSYWFNGCSKITSISGLQYLNTANVTEMIGMFSGCSALTSLDLSNFNTANVTSMSYMFSGCSGLTSLDLSHFNTANVTSMSYMFDGCFSLTNLDVSHFNTANVTSMSYMFSRCFSLTNLDVSHFNTANVTSMSYMFDGCSSLTNLDVSNFNTANVTSMSFMFSGCSGLTSLDLSHFNTANVTSMSYMFYGCSGLTSLDVSHFNTANVTDMSSMFSGCSGLTSLDVSNFNTANVMSMNFMFYGCSGLTSLDLSHFNTANVTDMNFMFSGCSGLMSLDVSNFNTANVTNMSFMFSDCSGLTKIYAGEGWSTSKMSADYSRNMFADCLKLVGGAGTVFDANHVDYTYAHIDGGTANPGYFTDKNATPIIAEPYAVLSDSNTVLTFYYDDQKAARNGMSVGPFTNEAARGWNDYMQSITTVTFDDTFANCTSITSTEKWCSGCLNLAVINGLNNLNTENVTTMNSMFADCRKLTNLDLSHFKTSNVTSMWAMFNNCLSLTELDMSNFNTENVNDTYAMFAGCSALTTIYVGSEWSTSKMSADYSRNMFADCLKLVGGAGTVFDANHVDYTYAHIDGGTANPGYFTDKNAAPAGTDEPYAVLSDNNTVLTFYYDDQMTARNGMSVASSIGDAPSQPWSNHVNSITSVVFDASFANCTTLASTAYWFLDCRQLTTISGISNLNTANVTNMTLMFSDCSSLTSLDVSHFNTANVTEMSAMFQSCSGLTSLDLNNFNTANVMYMSGLFFDCSGLTNLDMSNFNTEKVVDMNRMFIGCSSLAAIQAGSSAIPDSIYAQIENPNLLVYVNNASLAPSSVQNVVVNGQAREIVLTDATSGNNNFYVPQSFTAERISYTRNFGQTTQVGVSRGWESIALPFSVQTITHEEKGAIAPFGSNASNRHFWLRQLGGSGLQTATSIEANTPYVISMPNSADYTDSYNLAGRVTFSAENAQVPATEVKAAAITDSSIVMMPTMQRVSRSSAVWALNVGEVRGSYLEGSVFERDYREVRPFEAYTVHRQENSQPAPRYVPVLEIGGATGIAEMEDVRNKTDDVWYTTDGRKLQGNPQTKGVYIHNGQKIVVR